MSNPFCNLEWKRCSLGLTLLLTFTGLSAQVRSGAYRTMLNTLLAHSVPEIPVEQARQLDPLKVYFLDAREETEYRVSHLRNARFVGYDHFSLSTVTDIPKKARVVVYCSVGYRSEKVAEKLQAAGYQNVSNLYGGIFEWVNQGNQVVNEQGPTLKVHAYDRIWGVWLNKGEKVY